MKLVPLLISVLALTNLLHAEDIDTFLNQLKVPPLQERMCKDKQKDYTQYLQCLQEDINKNPSVTKLNYLASLYTNHQKYKKALSLYHDAIKMGDKKATYLTGRIYNDAYNQPEEALPYFLANKNYEDSTCQVGGIYSIVKDESLFSFMDEHHAKSKTLDFYEDEIEKGNTKAYACKSLYYMELEEYSNAKDAINEGMDNDDLTSLFLMGQWYDKYGDKHRDKRYEYYEKASAKGYIKATHNLGVDDAMQKNWEWAEKYFKLEVNQGNPDALMDLARVYKKQKKYVLAEKVYRKLAEFGNYKGLFRAGLMYADSGDKQNYNVAEKIYLECINYGYGLCASGLGLLYHEHYKNYDEAIMYYQLGYKMGNAKATFNLGHLYGELGDIDKKIFWYEESVKMGNAIAAFGLGHVYEDEVKDYPKAIVWYKKATSMGDIDYMGRVYSIEYGMEHENKDKQ